MATHTHGLYAHGPTHRDCTLVGWRCTSCRTQLEGVTEIRGLLPGRCPSCDSMLMTGLYLPHEATHSEDCGCGRCRIRHQREAEAQS